MTRRWLALLLVLGSIVAAASLSASASGADPQAQIAVFGCGGFQFETLSGVETGCRTIPPDLQGGDWSVAADGSMVGGGAGGGPDVRPVTLVKPNDQAVVLDSNPDDFDPTISPDGSKVAFVRAVPKNGTHAWPSNLFVMNSDGTGLKEIALGRGSSLRSPKFSPDGNTIAYLCQPAIAEACGPLPDGSFRQFAMLLINADGTNQRVIVVNNALERVSWSADGKEIATESIGPCACGSSGPVNTEIYVYHTDGTDLFNGGNPSENLNPLPRLQVTHESDVYGAALPQFLPGSSNQLVYYRAVDDNGGDWGYDYSINLDGTGRQELSLNPDGPDYGLIIPAANGAGAPPFVNVMRVRVPAVRRLTLGSAKQHLQGAGLTVGKIQRAYSAAVPKNHVVNQYPAGGKYAHRITRRGPSVKLTLSLGPVPASRR